MTVVEVDAAADRAALRLATGHLAPRVLSVTASAARVGLVAVTAILLGGDDVDIRVRVGAGSQLEIVEMAGTVAYNGRGAAASWSVTAEVGDGASLRWHGEPFVVADGADVVRSITIDLGNGATAVLRETLVLGRSGEPGGRLTTRTRVNLGPDPLWAEDLDLSDPRIRSLPGILGRADGVDRVMDSVMVLGRRTPDLPPAGQGFELDGPGTVARWLGSGTAPSPIPQWWSRWAEPTRS